MTLDLTTLFHAAVIGGGMVATIRDTIRWRRGDRVFPDLVRTACFWVLGGSLGMMMSTPLTAGLFAVLVLGPWDHPVRRRPLPPIERTDAIRPGDETGRTAQQASHAERQD